MGNSKETVTVIGALVVGALAGAALGVLFAPYKGSRTRNRLVRKAKNIGKDLKKKMKAEVNSLRTKVENLEHKT
jgi:gas vesicle protein